MALPAAIEMHDHSQAANALENQASRVLQPPMWQSAKKAGTLFLMGAALFTSTGTGMAGAYFLGGGYIADNADALNDQGVFMLTALVTVVSGASGGVVGALLARRIWYVFGQPALPCLR